MPDSESPYNPVRFLTTAELCERWRCDPKTLYRRRMKRELRAFNSGSRRKPVWLYALEEIEEYERRHMSDEDPPKRKRRTRRTRPPKQTEKWLRLAGELPPQKEPGSE